MKERLDSLDVKIVEALGTYGPRNLMQVAKALGVTRDLVQYRIDRMTSLFRLRTHVTVYHTNLGLKKAVLFINANPGCEDLLFDCLKINPFYIYLTRYYGMYEGCFAIFTIPVENCDDFVKFIEEIKKLGIAKDSMLYWSTCFHTINQTSQWFDYELEQWVFPWDEWVKEVPNQPTSLPYTLIDPEGFPMKADELDLLIMQELEVDATISLSEIAKKWKTSPQRIKYHYEKHIIERGLIEKFQISVRPFDNEPQQPIMLWFIFRFNDSEKMAKFASSLLTKPFALVVGKIRFENALVAQIYLPALEFRRFIESLSQICRHGLLQSYSYVIQDRRKGKWSRETIPFEDSKDGKWVYDHQRDIKKLHELAKKSGIFFEA